MAVKNSGKKLDKEQGIYHHKAPPLKSLFEMGMDQWRDPAHIH